MAGMLEAGRYRLTRRLGQGGMAEVFEGVAEGAQGFRRRVAIKRVLPQLASDAACARMFLDEARIASHLHHAGVVAVLDYGTIDGIAFQALEFVDGMDLDQLLRRADEHEVPLPTGLALHIATQVASALDHAHDARDQDGRPLSIVHRDVSPSNVLLSWDGHVKLSDFGIALAAGRLERTEGAGVKGKLEYMSPEQATRGHVDRRTDVFALGCVLHRMLAGHSPLLDLSVLARMAGGAELSLSDAIDPEIRAVIEKATRHAQAQRYASAGELARALSALVPRYLREEATLALKTWLAGVRDGSHRTAPKRGALDQLLDVELLLAPSDEAACERTFVAKTPFGQSAQVSAEAAPAALLSEPRSPGSSEASSPLADDAFEQPSKRGDAAPGARRTVPRGQSWAFGLSALTLGVGLALWLGLKRPAPAQGPEVEPSPIAAASVDHGAAHGARTVSGAADEEPAQPPRAPAALDAGVPSSPPTSMLKRARRRPTAPHEDAQPQSPALKPKASTAAATTAARGTLVVGGDGALRAEIRVDGKSVGYAPKRLELDAGRHQVALFRADGSPIASHSVEIATHHTQSAPARLIVP
jgi:serine/threonine-protein kinase